MSLHWEFLPLSQVSLLPLHVTHQPASVRDTLAPLALLAASIKVTLAPPTLLVSVLLLVVSVLLLLLVVSVLLLYHGHDDSLCGDR